MASHIQIKVGPLVVTREYPNDSKVEAVLLKFYEERQLGGPDTPNQEKLRQIIDLIASTLVRHAQEKEFEERRRILEDEVAAEYDLV